MGRAMSAIMERDMRAILTQNWSVPEVEMPGVMNALRRDIWEREHEFPRAVEAAVRARRKADRN